MEWNWPMGSSVGWAGWAGPAGQLAKEKIRKKKHKKKSDKKFACRLAAGQEKWDVPANHPEILRRSRMLYPLPTAQSSGTSA